MSTCAYHSPRFSEVSALLSLSLSLSRPGGEGWGRHRREMWTVGMRPSLTPIRVSSTSSG
jgi:hypothetical protein